MEEEQKDSPWLVRDLMTVGVPTCALGSPIVDLAEIMLAEEWEGVVVLDERGHAAGVITRVELVSAYGSGDHTLLTAEQVMRPDVPQVPPEIPLAAAAQIMQDLGVRVLFLMHHAGGIEYPAAWISYRHFIRHIAMRKESDLSDLGIKAARKSPVEVFLERRNQARKNAGIGS